MANGRFQLWSTGSAELLIAYETHVGRLPIAVRCRLGNHRRPVVAMLDTAAEWSILDGRAAALVQEYLDDLGMDPVTMKTRHGDFSGRLHRLSIELLADSGNGSDLAFDATVLVLPEWPGPVVLGFRGLLERIRLALDPDDAQPLFYFGARAQAI